MSGVMTLRGVPLATGTFKGRTAFMDKRQARFAGR
jgi:hypothetical protein